MPQLDYITSISIALPWLASLVAVYAVFVKFLDTAYLYYYETCFAIMPTAPYFLALVTSKALAYEWLSFQTVSLAMNQTQRLILSIKK